MHFPIFLKLNVQSIIFSKFLREIEAAATCFVTERGRRKSQQNSRIRVRTQIKLVYPVWNLSDPSKSQSRFLFPHLSRIVYSSSMNYDTVITSVLQRRNELIFDCGNLGAPLTNFLRDLESVFALQSLLSQNRRSSYCRVPYCSAECSVDLGEAWAASLFSSAWSQIMFEL